MAENEFLRSPDLSHSLWLVQAKLGPRHTRGRQYQTQSQFVWSSFINSQAMEDPEDASTSLCA